VSLLSRNWEGGCCQKRNGDAWKSSVAPAGLPRHCADCDLRRLPVVGAAFGWHGRQRRLRALDGLLCLGASAASAEERVFAYFISRYAFDPAYKWSSGFVSSALLPIAVTMPLNRLWVAPGWYDLRTLSAVYLALLLVATWLLLRNARDFPLAQRMTLAFFLLLALTDVGYVAWFNSFYSEPATLVFLLLTVACAHGLCRQPGWPGLAGFVFCLVLFLTAKPQNVPSALFFAPIVWRTGKLRDAVAWRRACALAAALVVLVSLAYWRLTLKRALAETTLYISVFTEILRHSPAPEADLAELGLEPALAHFGGSTPFTPGVEHQSPELGGGFYERISFARIGAFYLRHPHRLWALLNRAAHYALLLRPGRGSSVPPRIGNFPIPLGNFERTAGRPPWSLSASFSWWSNPRPHLMPSTAGGIALFFAFQLAGVVWLWRGAKTHAERWGSELHGTLLAAAVAQFVLVAILQGTIDPVKNQFLCCVLFDVCLVTSVVWLAGLRRRTTSRG